MNDSKCPVIVVYAPTACGKTALIQDLFGESSLSCFKGRAEVISADSQAVYRGMDIGTAKPTEEEKKNVPHHLIDIVDPDTQFGVGEFIAEADKACLDIYSRGKIPVVAGGTGFYVRNFMLGLPVTPVSNPEIRENLKKRLAVQGKEALHAELCVVDPKSASRINVNDEYRILRALEVFYTSGKPLSSYELPAVLRKQYNFCPIILNRSREELYTRIDERVEVMFRNGLKEEVDSLMKKGYTQESPGMKAIGYSEFFLYEKVDDIKEHIKNDSHHYAKKQYTFMRGIPDAVYLDAEDTKSIRKVISDFASSVL